MGMFHSSLLSPSHLESMAKKILLSHPRNVSCKCTRLHSVFEQSPTSRVCCGSLFHWYTGRARTTCLQCIIFLVMKSRFFLLYSIPNSVSILIRKRGRLTKSDMSCSKMRDRTAGARNSRQLFQVLKIWH